MKMSLLKLIASILLVATAIWWVDGAAVLRHLSTLSPGWLFLAVLAMTAAIASMARRWQVVAGHLGLGIEYSLALREYYIGSLINQVLPGGVTGDIARALRARRAVDLKTAALSVALERLLGQVAIISLFGVGLTVAALTPGGIEWGVSVWFVPVSILGAGVFWILLARQDGSVGRATALALAMQRRPELLLHAVFATACLIFAFYACARATGTEIPMAGWLTLIPLILLAMLIPFSVGGWGWREGAAAALFPLIGEPASAGVAAGIAYGGAALVSALPATLFLATINSSNANLNSDKRGLS